MRCGFEKRERCALELPKKTMTANFPDVQGLNGMEIPGGRYVAAVPNMAALILLFIDPRDAQSSI